MNSNPWQVDSIQTFYCLKCPECMFFSDKELDFKDHAIKNHPLSNLFFDKFKKNEDMASPLIDPAMIKEELCDTISEENCDLNFSGINDEYVDRIKVEENNETVFAENFDLKDSS